MFSRIQPLGPPGLLRSPDYLLIRELLQSSIGPRMLDRHAYKVPLPVEIDVDVLADLLGLGNLVVCKLHKGNAGIREVLFMQLEGKLSRLLEGRDNV